MNSNNDLSLVLNELRSIKGTVDLLKQDVGGMREQLNSPVSGAGKSGERRLEIFFTAAETERKPFLIQCEGFLSASVKLSAIRTAILLVLCLDLEDRLEGGTGVTEPLAAIEKTLLTIDPASAEAKNQNPEKIRVAIYRFWEFCQSSNFLTGREYSISFDDKLLRLSVVRVDGGEVLDQVQVEITSNESRLSAILHSTLTRSPLAQVRKRRALFVPPGSEGADRLLLEMYDHPYPLRVTSLYVRPPLTSYPDALLAKLGVSPRVLRRKELAFEGYRSNRFEFFEILNESTIWDLIRYSSKTGFKLYPRKVSKNDVAVHLDNLINILKNYENYHLFITQMVVPFVVVTYEIQSRAIPEFFTIFFQAFNSAAERDLGCFALYDRAVYQNITDHIVSWLLNHPSTIKSRSKVIALLQTVRDHLEEKGPLEIDAPNPIY